MIRMLSDIGGLERHRVSKLLLDGEVPLIRYRRTIVRILNVDSDSRKTRSRSRSYILDRAWCAGSSECRESLIECDLVGGYSTIGPSYELAHQIRIPRRVGRQPVVFTRAFLETGSAESRAKH